MDLCGNALKCFTQINLASSASAVGRGRQLLAQPTLEGKQLAKRTQGAAW
jgi:hypothetical protein